MSHLMQNPAISPPKATAGPHATLTPLESTLARLLITADSKGLTQRLNPLDATLTKKHREGAL